MGETVKVEVVRGVEGPSVYIDDHRVAGPKPWGGGTVMWRFDAKVEDIKKALRLTK